VINKDQMAMETRARFEKLLFIASGGDAAQMRELRGFEMERFFMYLQNKQKDG